MIAILEDGRHAPFCEMYDYEKEEVEDPKEACIVVVQHPDAKWVVIELGWFDSFTRH